MTIVEISYAFLGVSLGVALTLSYGWFMQTRRLRKVRSPRPPTAADAFWFRAKCQRCQAQNEYQLKDLNMMNNALCSACQTRNVYHSTLAERFE